MHIDAVPNRGSRPAYLLRESYREGKRVRKRTLANLSSLSDEQIDCIRAVLRGEQLGPLTGRFKVVGSRIPGPAQAVRVAMHGLGFAALLGARPSRQRDMVRDDCRAHHRPAYQAGDDALVALHDAGRGLRCGQCR